MQWKPNVTVAAIVCKNNRYLLAEEMDKSGISVFNQPAGHLEQGETLIDAVKREMLEETARQFHPEYLTGIYLRPDPDSGITYLRFCFYGSCSEPDPNRPLDTGIIRTVWMTQNDMQTSIDQMRSPLVMLSLQDFLSGKRYPLDILNSLIPTDTH